MTDKKIESLILFTKDNFSLEKIQEHVEELKYRQLIHDALLEEISYPSDELMHVIAKKVYPGILRGSRKKFIEKIIAEEIKDVFDNDYELDLLDVITIEEEMEGFYIIRAILSEITDSDRIFIRDRKSYCGVLLDDNHHYPICRLYFNDLDNLVVAFFDSMQKDKQGGRIEEKIAINKVVDIYDYKKKLLETVRAYDKIKK